MKTISKIFAVVMTVAMAVPAFAVTDKEMEEARAITAKAYLRYANDGSGYLDDFTVKSMAELQPKLKKTEVENLKTFTAVAVPKDYASWTKDKLVEYWGTTFFRSAGLIEKGKLARTRVRKQVMAMNIAAPGSAPAEQSPAATPAETETPAAESVAEAAEAQPTAAEAVAEQEDILNDQKAIDKDAVDAEMSMAPKQESHTWVYVVVLIILVGLIVWLVVYAANLMKRQPSPEEERDAPVSDEKLREQTRLAIAKKNEELAGVKERLRAEESRAAELSMEIERLKRDMRRQDEELMQLREENRRLAADAERRPAAEPVERRVSAEHVERRTSEPAERRPAAEQAEKQFLKVIYLGRANARGIFVRADRRFNPGNTIYRLDTNDGLVGTFHVVDDPEVVRTAMANPVEFLGNGCQCEDLEDTAGVTRIVSESAGTAIFENGYWKILRKTRIRYE